VAKYTTSTQNREKVSFADVQVSFTDPGRAFAHSIIQFFQQLSTDILPAPAALTSTCAETDINEQVPSQSPVISYLGNIYQVLFNS